MKTGPQLLEEIAKFPTLELMLDRSPHTTPYSPEELLQIVERERLERTMFNIKTQERKDKRKEKQGD